MQKTIAIVAALGFSLVAGAAQADALNGAYLGGGLSLNKFSGAKVSQGADSFTFGSDKHKPSLNLSAGYGATVSGQFHVAGELSYNNQFGKSDFTNGPTLGTMTGRLKDVWALSVLPGYKLSNNTLGFARLGVAKAKGELSVGGQESSSNFKGVLYGIGVKHALTQNLAVVAEYQSLVMDGKQINGVGYKPSANGVMLGVQYGF